MKRNKVTSVLLSLIIAFGLWLYVVTNVSKETDVTIYNVPVVLEGETLLNERNLMITELSADEVDVTLFGNRSDLAKLNNSNMVLKANLSDVNEPQEKKPLTLTPVYPSDVASSTLTIDHRNPANVYVTVEARRNKPVPVEVVWIGSTPEGYMSDRENRVLDNASVNVVGPASVADLIEKAVIEVDLSEQRESISQDYRYTLCDAQGNAVDAELITTNVETIHLDVKIYRIKEIVLMVDVVYGGGATNTNTKVEVDPFTIRVAGSNAVLEELGDSINLGKVDLSTIEKSQTLKFPISLPEGITNLSNITEADVDVQYSGLLVKTFEVVNFEAINVPEEYEAEIMEKKLSVVLRGPAAELMKITEEDIVIRADFANAVPGTSTFKAIVHFGEEFSAIGAVGSYTITANVWETE